MKSEYFNWRTIKHRELEPCPCCGSSDNFHLERLLVTPGRKFQGLLRCGKCGRTAQSCYSRRLFDALNYTLEAFYNKERTDGRYYASAYVYASAIDREFLDGKGPKYPYEQITKTRNS